MAEIVIDHLTKAFDGPPVVDDVSLTVADGEFLVLLGPSGCGKTTTLRMVAGLETVSGGRILIGGRETQDLHPADRDVAMVFQNYALYPHMSVYDNLAYGLRRRGVAKARIDEQVRTTAQLLQIDQFLKRKPAQLSGGQRQRVALGRAIVRHPAAFLMDEPLSNLDAKLRVDMRTELSRLHAELGVTTMYVTHDQVEAMTMGHRIAVMDKGHLQQIGAPLELYRRPANIFVAAFLGTPAINLVPGSLTTSDGRRVVRTPGSVIEVPDGVLEREAAEVTIGIRPQAVRAADAGAHDGRTGLGTGVIEVVEHLGSESFAVVRQGDLLLTALVDPDTRHERGDEVALSAVSRAVLFFDTTTGERIGGGIAPGAATAPAGRA